MKTASDSVVEVTVGYLVKKLGYKNRSWKVQYESQSGGVRRARDIPEKEYGHLGISPGMSLEAVKGRCTQLSAQLSLKRLQERRNAIQGRLKEEELRLATHFQPNLLEEFEQTLTQGKEPIYWRVSKRALISLPPAMEYWSEQKKVFYAFFKKKGYSLSYIQKLVLMINKWGKFVSKRSRTYFDPIPMPTGHEKEAIVDHHAELKRTKASMPITPQLLFKKTGGMNPQHLNWIYLSIWLGLRPGEVDQLKEPSGPKSWRLQDGVLWVYQRKLSGLPSVQRWKPIPLKYPEQSIIPHLIANHDFKRPLNKTLRTFLGCGYTCYGGRKGFVDLMLEKGNSLESISQWLGHTNINRTWKTYKDRKKVLMD